jgi:hypothetical protein
VLLAQPKVKNFCEFFFVKNNEGHPILKEMVKFLDDDPARVRGAAWITVGPKHISKFVMDNEPHWTDYRVAMYPFYYFVPNHHGEHRAVGNNPKKLELYGSYARNMWGTTFNTYESKKK